MSNHRPPTQGLPLLLRLWHEYVVRYAVLLLLACLLMAIEGGSMALLAKVIQPMLDQMVTPDGPNLTWVAAAVVLVFLLRAVSGLSQRVISVHVSLRVISDLQQRLLSHLLKLDTSFFQHNPPGSLIERVRGDAQALQGLASQVLTTLVRDSVALIALLITAISIDWRWTLMTLVGIPLLILPVYGLQTWIIRTSRAARQSSADISNRLDEIFHGMNAIKLNNLQEYEANRFADGLLYFRRVMRRSEIGRAGLPAAVDVVAGLGLAGMLLYAGMDIMAGEKTIGQLASFFVAMGLIFEPLRRLGNLSGLVQAAMASLERLYGLLDQPADLESKSARVLHRQQALQDIVFDRVSLSYDDKPVLSDLSLLVPSGKMVALVGPSGAGKTTLFNLLTRLVEPDGGNIRLGNEPITAFTRDSLRSQIAVVSQEAAIFDESLRDNIALGDLSASEERIQLAADRALVSEFAPDLSLSAGVRGSALSGGQRQRLAIARALLKNAPILLLDEATSALDNQTEQRIQQQLLAAAKGCTTIVIAHRLSTVLEADWIYVLEQGRVVQQGQHKTLLAQDGLYKRLNDGFF